MTEVHCFQGTEYTLVVQLPRRDTVEEQVLKFSKAKANLVNLPKATPVEAAKYLMDRASESSLAGTDHA